MFKTLIKTILLVIFLITPAYGKTKIITTISPLAYFIEKIGGEYVEVYTMIPPGGNPHTYEPTPAQMSVLSKADMYVKAGSGIEFELMWMAKLSAMNKDLEICDLSTGIDLIDAPGEEEDEHQAEEEHDAHDHRHHGAKDPHIWLSPENGIIMAQNFLRAITRADPGNSEYYRKNALDLSGKLAGLKKDIRKKLEGIKNRNFFIFHPAWGYFARDFNLTQIPIEFSGKEPTPERLTNLVKKAKHENIKVIFTSPQFSKKSAEVIANEIRGKVVFIDPMSGDYIKNLQHTADMLRNNMK